MEKSEALEAMSTPAKRAEAFARWVRDPSYFDELLETIMPGGKQSMDDFERAYEETRFAKATREGR
jgi:hypothetical protein